MVEIDILEDELEKEKKNSYSLRKELEKATTIKPKRKGEEKENLCENSTTEEYEEVVTLGSVKKG